VRLKVHPQQYWQSLKDSEIEEGPAGTAKCPGFGLERVWERETRRQM
jgi:hypothetical protein